MSDSHEEVADLLGVYALGAIPEDERRMVEAHLVECPACAAEVAAHLEVVDLLATAREPAPEPLLKPPSGSRERSPPAEQASGVAGPASIGALTSSEPVERRLAGHLTPFVTTAAAIALVFGVAAGTLIGTELASDGDMVDIAQVSLDEVARRVMTDPRVTTVTLSSPDGELSADVGVGTGGSGYLVGTDLPVLDPSRTYQLWAIRGDVAISLGVLGPAPAVVAFHFDGNIETMAITEETRGGVPSSSNEPVVVGQVS